MYRLFVRFSALNLAVACLVVCGFGQTYYCKRPVLAARKTIPKLNYTCREDVADYESEVLKYPERVTAVRRYTKALEAFNSPAWWSATVDDLTYCDIHRKVGPLSKKEKAELKGGEYFYSLYGNREIRVIKTTDPCYYTGFGGSDIFLLYRAGGRTKATEVIDGYSSRAENSIFVNFARLNGEQIVEIATSTGGLNPMVINYYFVIDRRSGRAKPKNLFKTQKGITNVVTSMMLLGDPEDYGLPPKSEPLVIIKNGRLRRSFSSFDDTGVTTGGENNAKFVETIMRWNGKYYQ